MRVVVFDHRSVGEGCSSIQYCLVDPQRGWLFEQAKIAGGNTARVYNFDAARLTDPA
jgi:hypothetical protein